MKRCCCQARRSRKRRERVASVRFTSLGSWPSQVHSSHRHLLPCHSNFYSRTIRGYTTDSAASEALPARLPEACGPRGQKTRRLTATLPEPSAKNCPRGLKSHWRNLSRMNRENSCQYDACQQSLRRASGNGSLGPLIDSSN